MGDASNSSGAGAPAEPGGFQAFNDGHSIAIAPFSSRMSDAASAPANSTPAGMVPAVSTKEAPAGSFPKKRNSANWGLHFRKPELWTDERREVLRREWLAKTPGRELLPKLNALPGEPLRMPQVYAYATRVMRLPVRFAAVSNVWTPERDEVIRREYPNDTSLADIYALVSPLRGSPIKNPRAIKERARAIGVQRSRTFMDELIRQHRFKCNAWTTAREDLLRQMWPVKANSQAAIMEAVNALDGRPVTWTAIQQRAKKLDLNRPKGRAIKVKAPVAPKPAPKPAAPKKAPPRFVPYAAPEPAPEPPPEYDAGRATSMEARMEKAREAFRKSMNADPSKLVQRLHLPMRLVLQAKGDVRREAA